MGVGEDWVAVIIEDDPDVRDLIDIVLTQSGFRTVVTQDGYEGVEAVRAHNPLITTLDVNMPGMDGFAAAKRLREFSNTYLIMITALGDEIDVVQGFEAGADDYLVKPFRPRELRARADSMLRRPRARQETPSGWSEGADDTPVSPVAAPAAVPPPPAPEPVKEESWAARAARDLTANAPHRAAPAPVQQPVQPPVPEPTYQQPPAHQPPAQPVAPRPTPQPAYASPAPEQASQPTMPVPAAQLVPPALQGEGVPRPDGSWVRFNGLALNPETRVVTVGGGSIDLNRTEFDLLASLLSTGRRVRSKADLVLTMRGQQYVTSYFVNEADKRSVEVHIASMRRKLNDNDQNPRFIETVRGVGYRLAEPV
ncbi:response regulator transcription factor [Nocardioides sp. LS1]|uniref:response regulator transcription factor n=1 Tax=Nocardioides sp. LS1 TaxID=1027620 RepID=UPI000F6172EC|nr:response regulator transcription factor [Nocardioides sp. LS1]GCD92288.1 hypothetical protein NLS1_42940 [Nocardioides sp. LS1]